MPGGFEKTRVLKLSSHGQGLAALAVWMEVISLTSTGSRVQLVQVEPGWRVVSFDLSGRVAQRTCRWKEAYLDPCFVPLAPFLTPSCCPSSRRAVGGSLMYLSPWSVPPRVNGILLESSRCLPGPGACRRESQLSEVLIPLQVSPWSSVTR